MLTYSFQQNSWSALKTTGDLLNHVFGRKHFTPEFLRWQYYDNPMGESIAFSAFDEGKFAGHYAGQPIISRIDGAEISRLDKVNAAIRSENQGQGIWGKLNKLVQEEAEK
jgi:hypothetical protein